MIVRIVLILGILGHLIAPVFVVPTVQADGPFVVINELLWMGSSASSADEWIELRNLTDQPVDISGWQMTKKSSGVEAAMLTIPTGKVIPAQGFFVISNYAQTNANAVLETVPDYVITDVALSNSALQIKLYDAAHTLVDAADDGVGNPLSGTFDSATKKYVSMERNIVPGDGTIAQYWHAATKSLGFKASAVEFGTPGTANSNALPMAAAGPDQSGVAGQEINFDGSDSSDPEGQVLTHAWDFGDGTISSEVTPKHAYSAAGAFIVRLVVSDGIDMASDTMNIAITNAPAAAPPSEPTPTLVVETQSQPVAPIPTTLCQGMKISELYPNPPGVDNDEFIELVNTSDEEIITGPCTVTVSLKSYPVPVGQAVPVNGFVLMKKADSHFTLTNTGATVKLLDSDGTELDRAVYETAPEGKSWALIKSAWQWTATPTANNENMLVLEAAGESSKNSKSPVTKSTSDKSVTTNKKVKKVEVLPQEVTIAQVQELDSGDKVIVKGVLTAPVGALGATISFIQDGNAGVAIAVPNGEPSVKVGDQVEITGTVRMSQGRRRVAVATKGIHVVGSVELKPIEVATDDVSQDQADQLVHVKGLVALASGNRIEIDDGSGPVPVYLKSSTGIVRPKVKAGDTVDAIGIVSVSTSGVRVLPRSQDDLKVERVLGAATVAPVPVTNIPASSTQQSLWYWLMAGAGGVAAAVKPAWKAWKSRLKVEG